MFRAYRQADMKDVLHFDLQDMEQLLHAHGLHSMGATQLLQNLYKLLAAAASGAPPTSSSSMRAGSY